MPDIPSECVWGLKIVKNWQKTPRGGVGAWSDTTELVAAFEKEWKSACDFCNPQTLNHATFQNPGLRSQGRASPQQLHGVLMQLICKKNFNIFLWLELSSGKQKGLDFSLLPTGDFPTLEGHLVVVVGDVLRL